MTDSSSYSERHQRAAATFQRFVPDADPERVAASLGRRLGVLGSFAFDVVGDMWSRPALNLRDRSLLVIAVLAAQARDEELELHTANGLRHGLTRVEIEEILPHVAAYAGFPAAMAASRRVDAALRAAEGGDKLSDRAPAAQKSDAERDRDAAAVFRTISGGRGALYQEDTLVTRYGGSGGISYWVARRARISAAYALRVEPHPASTEVTHTVSLDALFRVR